MLSRQLVSIDTSLRLTFDLLNGISGFFWHQCVQVMQHAGYRCFLVLAEAAATACIYNVFVMYNVGI